MVSKIVITATGAGDMILVDWSDVILRNPSLDPTFEVQEVKYLRGAEAVYFDRGNEQTTIEFTVAKLWTTLEKAFNWRDMIRSLVPRIGQVNIQQKGYTGAITNRWLRSAAVMVKSQPNTGLTTYTDVKIMGGAMLSAPP